MSLLPKPKKPKSHSNSDIALDDLKKHLPREWNKAKNVDDDDSGYEWGEDWKIEIVENEVVTGVFFSVQSKVLDGNDAINSNGIGTEINVTTINRLFDIPYPVLIHYVHPKTGTSYVVWLDDWMAKQSDLNWRTKENGTVTLRIPLLPENQLDSDKVEKIKQHALMSSFQHGNDKVVDLINRTSKDYRIDMIKKKEGITFIINALHEEAIPHVALLDVEAIQSHERAIDTGLPTPILGQVSFSNIPPLILQQMQNMQLQSLVATPPAISARRMVLSMEILDKDEKSLYKISSIDMEMIQKGRKIVKWKGISRIDGVVIFLDINPENPVHMDINFEMTQDDSYPLIYLNRIKFIQALQKAKKFDLRELTLDRPFGDISIENIQLNTTEPIPESEIEIAETLVNILKRMNIEIQFPDKYSNRDVTVIQIIKQILDFGRVLALKDFPETPSGIADLLMDPISIPKMLEEFDESKKKGENNTVIMPIFSLSVKLFGREIKLGERVVVLHVTNIEKISDETIRAITGDEAKEVQVKFDLDKSFTVYKDWCSSNDRTHYFAE